MKKQDEEHIKYIKENGDGYVTIQQDLTGKTEGQTEFKVEGSKKVKLRHYPQEKEGGLTRFVKGKVEETNEGEYFLRLR